MRIFRITIRADKFPLDFNVNASDWSTAIARAVREWKKRFKGSRTTELHIKAIRSGELLTTNSKEEDKDN